MPLHVLAIGVVRKDANVLLVRQGGSDGPGYGVGRGRVDGGELAVEALARHSGDGGSVAECYFRRDDSGEDSALLLG
jgi:hypothetical protein